MSRKPVILCILDGVGWGRRDQGDAVASARTPHLDALMASQPWTLLKAHGTAVGMPSDADMGNSEVGHNAMGAGRVFDQGAKLVDAAISSGRTWEGPAWQDTARRCQAGGTLHLLGLLSDGNVHSNVSHVRAIVERAIAEGIEHLRLHALTDGRDVSRRSALTWVEPLEALFRETGRDYAFASGGGRMNITMDRYEADWDMVARGWQTHVNGEGRRFDSASLAIQTLYDEDPEVDDQRLPAFVVGDFDGMRDGDAVVFFNFRGDRAIEISRAFEGRAPIELGPVPELSFAGMMEYDGDLHIPHRFLVAPPTIDHTVGEIMADHGLRVLSISETQKFGHVTYFFNGNRSDALPGEDQVEVPSDNVPFDQLPAMKAREITAQAAQAILSGQYDHIRLNLANGDMVGHIGVRAAVIQAMEVVDECVGQLVQATRQAGATLLVTADHGNADEVYLIDKKSGEYACDADGTPLPSTAHSLNPVPLVLVDATGHWTLDAAPEQVAGSIARIGGTLLALTGLPVPDDYLPPLVEAR